MTRAHAIEAGLYLLAILILAGAWAAKWTGGLVFATVAE